VKAVQLDRDILEYLALKAVSVDEPISAILRRELNLSTAQIDDDIYAYIVSKIVDVGESASAVLRRELNLQARPGPGSAMIQFHIPAGTGGRPWNSPENAINARVGDTLRIVNDDAVPHRLHTAGVPFPHPESGILPGQKADFFLEAPFGGPGSALQDHDFGPEAAFFVMVLPRQ
jgi:negative regulator of replication initiation